MRMKRLRVASLDEVRITRDGADAIIEYADPAVSTTCLRLGPEVQRMTDREILDRFNEGILAMEQSAAEYEHVAVEIPPGRPQIEYSEQAMQWAPRGGVLRCVVDDGGPDGEPVIHVDDHALSLSEFGKLLCTYAGWGMRITFVPGDELHEEPRVEIREPEEDE